MSEPILQQRPQLKMLSAEQLARLHQASLHILQQTGVEFRLPEVVSLLRTAGAKVEGEWQVRIPPALVEAALQTAPKQLTIYDRGGEPALRLAGHNVYFGPGWTRPSSSTR